jgi:hypothetical protein
MAESEEGFKVTDRRRKGDDEPVQPPSRPMEIRGPTPPPTPEPRPAAPRESGRPAPERSLVGLFMMLGSSAAIAMGAAADPVTGQRHRDLDQAAEIIDVLLLLREKTEGRRTPAETQVLEDLVYDLQLGYVEARKRPG